MTPAFVCPGEQARVEWSVVGPASLRAQRGDHDWDEGIVPSNGAREVAVSRTSTFTLTATDAKQANGQWQANQTVYTPSPDDSERGAPATCGARECTASFDIGANVSAARVAKVGLPVMVRLGKSSPADLTVVHGTWSATVKAGETVSLNEPAGGPWILKWAVPEGGETSPPPLLKIHFDYACGH